MMPFVKRRYLWWTLALLPIFLACYLLAAWLLSSLSVNNRQLTGNITLYLANNGVHTDILLPMQHPIFDWHTLVNPETETRAQLSHPAYLGIGWGERNFYLNTPTWSDLRFTTALKAISGVNETLIHIEFYAQAPREIPNHVLAFQVSDEQYRRLVQAIMQRFQLTQAQKAIPIREVHYHDFDAFYQAKGRYHLFHTCNTEVNNWLKSAGLPAVVWTPLSAPLFKLYQER